VLVLMAYLNQQLNIYIYIREQGLENGGAWRN